MASSNRTPIVASKRIREFGLTASTETTPTKKKSDVTKYCELQDITNDARSSDVTKSDAIKNLNIKILVIDNQTCNQMIIRKHLKTMLPKASVTLASSGDEGIAKINDVLKAQNDSKTNDTKSATDTSSAAMPFDILICDYRMPDRVGDDVAKEIQEIDPKICIFTWSRDFQETTKQETFGRYMFYLPKPFLAAQVDRAPGYQFFKAALECIHNERKSGRLHAKERFFIITNLAKKYMIKVKDSANNTEIDLDSINQFNKSVSSPTSRLFKSRSATPVCGVLQKDVQESSKQELSTKFEHKPEGKAIGSSAAADEEPDSPKIASPSLTIRLKSIAP